MIVKSMLATIGICIIILSIMVVISYIIDQCRKK
jgi:hypothetical protein